MDNRLYITNPLTKKQILADGPTAKKLMKQGIIPMSYGVVKEKSFVINPYTGKQIDSSGFVAKKIEKSMSGVAIEHCNERQLKNKYTGKCVDTYVGSCPEGLFWNKITRRCNKTKPSYSDYVKVVNKIENNFPHLSESDIDQMAKKEMAIKTGSNVSPVHVASSYVHPPSFDSEHNYVQEDDSNLIQF